MPPLAHIAIFAFNRPNHLRRMLESLIANELAEQSHVTFFCDGPRDPAKYPEDVTKCAVVREIAHRARGFASFEVVERIKNMGCANSIINGLMQMFNKYERLIVFEDDILTSPYTLAFLNKGLERYARDHNVFNISAWSFPTHLLTRPKWYTYDVYSVPRFNCWGWASWQDRFANIDWNVKNFTDLEDNKDLQRSFCAGGEDMYPMLVDQIQGKIDSWAIRADLWRFYHSQVGINPMVSYTTNIGMGCGTHTLKTNHRLDNDMRFALNPDKIHWLNNVSLTKTIVQRYRLNYRQKHYIKQRVFELFRRFIHLSNYIKDFLNKHISRLIYKHYDI